MVTSRGVIIPCLVAVVILSCDSAYQELNSLNDLKEINFGKSVPKHSLLLLHWFANTVDIDSNDNVILTFDPNTDFGSHHYGNYEDMLDPLPWGYRYYTVGNINQDTSHELPDYVLDPPVREYNDRDNMDRIIFRVQQISGVHRIDRVYITQHYRPLTRYDPEHTYQISTNLLQQIRLFSVEENQRSLWELRDHLRDQSHSSADDSQLIDLTNAWSEKLACLGLLLFIVIQEKYSNRPVNRLPSKQPSDQIRPQPKTRNNAQPKNESNTLNKCEETCHLNLLVQNDGAWFDLTGKDENARHQPEQDGSVVPLVNDHTDQKATSTLKLNEINEVTTTDSSVPLNDGLQDWQQEANKYFFKALTYCFVLLIFYFTILVLRFLVAQFFWYILATVQSTGGCSQHPGRVKITGYNAHLEFFVREDKACARLYVTQYFRSQFQWSWVGFYKSGERSTNEYEWGKWQWVTKFEPCFVSVDYNEYNCFEYCSDMVAASGVQARFILRQGIEIARTPSFQRPDGVAITGYDAHLQLCVRDGTACARLYVKNSFTDWKSEFERSWVGFYKSAERDTNDYAWWQWQWATEFKQLPNFENYWEYDIFEYCSEMVAIPGVQVRFILKDTIEKARTLS